MPNSPVIPEFLVGGAMLGAIMVPINTRLKASELHHIITDAELTTVVTTAKIDDHVNFKELLLAAFSGLAETSDSSRCRSPALQSSNRSP